MSAPAAAQQPNNDGFHRRNGQMHVLRNGQLRPMTRDSRLPTGVLVTKDGFLVRTDGTRTELREGQACDFNGNVVAVRTAAAGGLALSAPVSAARRVSDDSPAAAEIEAVLVDVFDRVRQREERWEKDDDHYDGKHAKKAWEKRKKEEEKWRESEKKREEKAREYYKKREGKRREGKEWDD
ncbi:DUF6799 domain-containing protein [Hymenobacter terrenus]|uniref:DUF6799 domain-containing protein n=1 Tax=Hymenobacter terrenus TaxID=1629124 RepID=UPI0012E08DFB|nr:DUF6799 domain-containing protein [Hymenobacter terrenus]